MDAASLVSEVAAAAYRICLLRAAPAHGAEFTGAGQDATIRCTSGRLLCLQASRCARGDGPVPRKSSDNLTMAIPPSERPAAAHVSPHCIV
jgi:hypothetical protein